MQVVFLSLLLSCAFAASYPESDFEQLAALTCEGDLFLLPDHPELGMRLNFTNVISLYEMFINRMYSRVQCPCPGISMDEFLRVRAYYTPDFWANMLTNKNNHTKCYQWLNNPRYRWDGPYINTVRRLLDDFDLQLDWSTCNADLYAAGKGCTMSFYVTSLNIKLQIAIRKCSQERFTPYVSLTCRGKMCSRFMMPCNSQNDCGEGRCHGLAYRSADNPNIALEDLLETLKISYILDGDDGDNPQQAVTFYEDLLGAGRRILYGFSDPLKLAAPSGFVNFPVCSPSLSIMGDDWTSACNVDYSPNGRYSVTCDAFSTWDGFLLNGDSVFSSDRVSGDRWRRGYLADEKVVPVSEGTVLADVTCSGQISFLPKEPNAVPVFQGLAPFAKLYALSEFQPEFLSFLAMVPMSLKFPLNTLYKYAAQFLKNFEQQRAISRGGILSGMAFSLTWAWEQFLYDWVQAPAGHSKPSEDHGPQMSSLRTFMQELLNSPFYQVSLSPNSCSWERWTSKGECSGSYSGFSKLFEVDATIRLSAKSCGEDTIPALQAVCVGEACSGVFGSPIACNSQTDCKGGLICAPLTDKQYLTHNYDPLFLAAIIEGDYRHFANDTYYSKCAGYSNYQTDMKYFLSNMGLQGVGVGVCQVNWTKVTYYDPTEYYWERLRPSQHLLDWVSQAMQTPIQNYLINLNWFADWFTQ